ncbi:alpha-1,4-fucosyltransferase [Gigaspora margarita]|uniref:Fucosyltransferase n=1 Tax=Gigaspora margarita TaxID=4874 RepID=A0A8H4A483_GIGMA|nr:alpha-1,4-fucosyltransferase [Gigaspora margarita]
MQQIKILFIYIITVLFFVIFLSLIILQSTIKVSINELEHKINYSESLIDKLKIKPKTFIEWKQRHYITKYFNNNTKVKVYITYGRWYDSEDLLRLTYNHDGTLVYCDIPCIWERRDLTELSYTELKTADAIFNIDNVSLPKKKARKGQKFITLSLEPKTHNPDYYHNGSYDIYSSFDEDSDIPTSYVRIDPDIWRIIPPFNITKLSPNSTLISFIATHATEFRKSFVPLLQAHMNVAAFGAVHWNTPWELYPECLNLGKYDAKNCAISKYPFYLAIENCQEKDYSTEKLWDVFNLGVVPVIWGAPNIRSYLPHPKSAILIDDFPDVEALANYLRYLTKNETAYLEHHKWRTMKFSDGLEKKSYMSIRNLECNICKEVARLRILEGRI